MRNAGLDEAQPGIKFARRNINNVRYADDMTLIQFTSVAQSFMTPCAPWAAACQASLSTTNSYSLLKLMFIESVIATNCGEFKRWEYQTTLPASWEICRQVKKQQLELDMEQ